MEGSLKELYKIRQRGFRKRRSRVTSMIKVYDKLTECIDVRKSANIVYLDFTKVFDSILHER